MYMIKASTGAY